MVQKQQTSSLYTDLGKIREIFYKQGRISDANQKLDETVKLLSIIYAGENQYIPKEEYRQCLSKDTFSIPNLQHLFDKVGSSELFLTGEGDSLFEHSPRLLFSEGEEELAFELFATLRKAFSGTNEHSIESDIINSSFSYFIRDNFRNNIEDAQYMTPIEVVDFMVQMSSNLVDVSSKTDVIVMDPSCGVGSFLHRFHQLIGAQNRNIRYVAQDKVERMARLTAANFVFSNVSKYDVEVGNSLFGGSPLDDYTGKADLILTNPPFGAKITRADLQAFCLNTLPSYSRLSPLPASLDSELAFIDRYLALLKPGGVCLAVVPDGVLSAKGPASLCRTLLHKSAELLAVIDLPSVTFAQAGTRTKTAILAFRKGKSTKQQPSFVADVSDIGFEVSQRKGVAIKKPKGKNQLPEILERWQKGSGKPNLDTKKAAFIEQDFSVLDAWTPKALLHANAASKIGEHNSLELNELAGPIERRRLTPYYPGAYFISVLHVIGEALLDLDALFGYRPKTPGRPVYPGEVLVSRINPRIPRVLVVPELPGDIICSTEFEVLKTRSGIDPYHLAFYLLMPKVKEQIEAQSSGTSSSHSRIKPGKIFDIKIPWIESQEMQERLDLYRETVQGLFQSNMNLKSIRAEVQGTLQGLT